MVAAPPAAVATPFIPPLAAGDALPLTTLIDQRGRPFVLGGRRDGATLVAFFYTRCPDEHECPLTSAKFAKMQSMLGKNPAHLVEITIDPHFDTPSVLARYAQTFAADPRRWTLATGSASDTTMLERRLGVAVAEQRPGVISHEDVAVILDPAGRVAERIAGNTWTPREAFATTLAVEGGPSDPVARVTLALREGFTAVCGGRNGGLSLAAGLAILSAFVVVFAIVVRT
jgi:cytochrome oxidase Cu insertion factor (SCO1/SenC/PrrC family)